MRENERTKLRCFPIRQESVQIFLISALFLFFPTILPLSNVALLLLVATWLLTFNRQIHERILRETSVVWILSALYLMVLVGIAWSPAPWDWISLHLAKYAKLLYAVVLIFFLVGNERLQRAALNAFVVAMLFILLSTWLNVWIVLPWSITQETGWGKTHHVVGDYITQNVMMAFFTAVLIQKLIHAKKTGHRIFWGVSATLAALSITHLSQGRTGLIVLFSGLISYVVVTVRGRWLAGAFAGIVLVLGIALVSSSLLADRFSVALQEFQRSDVDKVTSIGHRLYNYQTTIELISERPVFGHGTGAYHTEICRFIDADKDCSLYSWHPHNQFLLFGADHGLLGVVLYALLIFSLYYLALRSRRLEGKALLCVLVSILVVDSMFNSPLYSSRESQFFIYMIGLLVSMNQPLSAEWHR